MTRIKQIDVARAKNVAGCSPEVPDFVRPILFALINSTNRKTGDCYPSDERIADLIGKDSRTVRRATAAARRLGLISVARHAGRNGTNKYTINWARFRQLDEAWWDKFNGRPEKTGEEQNRTNLSGERGQICPEAADKSVPQTPSGTPTTKPTLSRLDESNDQTPSMGEQEIGLGKGSKRSDQRYQIDSPDGNKANPGGKPMREAARDAAERRWSDNLKRHFGQDRAAWAAENLKISETLAEAATAAEMANRGTGLRVILDGLAKIGTESTQTLNGCSRGSA